MNEPKEGILVSSSASSKVTVSTVPFAVAEANRGPVLSPALPAGRSAKLGSAALVLSLSTGSLAGLS